MWTGQVAPQLLPSQTLNACALLTSSTASLSHRPTAYCRAHALVWPTSVWIASSFSRMMHAQIDNYVGIRSRAILEQETSISDLSFRYCQRYCIGHLLVRTCLLIDLAILLASTADSVLPLVFMLVVLCQPPVASCTVTCSWPVSTSWRTLLSDDASILGQECTCSIPCATPCAMTTSFCIRMPAQGCVLMKFADMVASTR